MEVDKVETEHVHVGELVSLFGKNNFTTKILLTVSTAKVPKIGTHFFVCENHFMATSRSPCNETGKHAEGKNNR